MFHVKHGKGKQKKTMISILLGCIFPPVASAQLAVSANDGKVRLDNGVVKTVPTRWPNQRCAQEAAVRKTKVG